MKRKRYKNAPIQEAVCDLYFQPGVDWEPTIPGRIYEKLKTTYDEKPRQQYTVETELQGVSPDDHAGASLRQKFGQTRIQLVGDKGRKLASLWEHRLAIHLLPPYRSWELFLKQIKQGLKAYEEVVRPPGLLRIGLRYVNRIVLEASPEELGDFFTIPPRFPESSYPTSATGFFNRKELQYLDLPMRAAIMFAEMEMPDSNKHSYLLDIDVISMHDGSPLAINDFLPVLKSIKDRHRDVFESLITNHLRAIFDAK